ncbi:uncharacterized protein LOC131951032 [Physella acuta]|uniref:uncharacterized protein LOC131951032 n=1 Tax=Physella acuta TaxID=109671 RepID=UPI0027DC403E|nr:uncharacterized protein LOC131951032 [Physella acuta]
MDHVTRGYFTANRRVGLLAPSLEDVTASLSPVHLDPWSARPDVGHTGVTGSYLDIRIEERHQVRSAVKPGVVVQVCGPPMVGKATIVRQVIDEMKKDSPDSHIQAHTFDCQHLGTAQDLLVTVVRRLCPQHDLTTATQDLTMTMIGSVLRPEHHHIFLFTKCEGFLDGQLPHCLSTILHFCNTNHVKVSIIFTTCRKFPASKLKMMRLVEVGMLTDVYDVTLLLQQCAPRVDVQQYVGLCRKLFCLPGPIMHFARKYLCDLEDLPNPHELELKVSNDSRFLSEIFEQSASHIERWISDKDLRVLYYFSITFGVIFTLDQVQDVYTDLTRQRGDVSWTWFLKRHLREIYSIWPVTDTQGCTVTETERFSVHPLMVYYRQTRMIKESLVVWDQSYNSHTQFCCHALKRAEVNMRLHERRGEVYGCLAPLWPRVKLSLEMAAHCQEGTFDAFYKVGVHARRFIILNFPNESRQFFKCLWETASKYGTVQQAAVMEAFLGHNTAIGQGSDFQQAMYHLDKAIETLRVDGPVYMLKWAVRRKAIILFRQSHYNESWECFQQANHVTQSATEEEVDEVLRFSELEILEEELTARIYEVIPLIFRGQPGDLERALQQQLETLDVVRDLCPNHPELPVLLNNLGLILQRGYNDLPRALGWFTQSYNERRLFERIAPSNVCVTLKNMTGICFQLGDLGKAYSYCRRALEAHTKYVWCSSDTALSLSQYSEVLFNMENVTKALTTAISAADMFKETNPKHNYRLRISLNILHYKIVEAYLKKHSRAVDRILLKAADILPPQTTQQTIPEEADMVPPQQTFPKEADMVPPQQTFPEEADMVPPQQTFPEEADNVPPLLTSCSDCLSSTLQLGKTMLASLNSEGHHYMLSVYEHAMMLTWLNTDQLTYYKTQMLNYVQENTGLKNLLQGREPDETSDDLAFQHRGLYSYIRETSNENLRFETFVDFVSRSCQTCQYTCKYYGESLWEMFRHMNDVVPYDIRTLEFSGFSSLSSTASDTEDIQTYGFDPQSHGSDQQSHGSDQQSHGSDQLSHGSDQLSHGSDQLSHGSDQQSHGSDQQSHGSYDHLPDLAAGSGESAPQSLESSLPINLQDLRLSSNELFSVVNLQDSGGRSSNSNQNTACKFSSVETGHNLAPSPFLTGSWTVLETNSPVVDLPSAEVTRERRHFSAQSSEGSNPFYDTVPSGADVPNEIVRHQAAIRSTDSPCGVLVEVDDRHGDRDDIIRQVGLDQPQQDGRNVGVQPLDSNPWTTTH